MDTQRRPVVAVLDGAGALFDPLLVVALCRLGLLLWPSSLASAAAPAAAPAPALARRAGRLTFFGGGFFFFFFFFFLGFFFLGFSASDQGLPESTLPHHPQTTIIRSVAVVLLGRRRSQQFHRLRQLFNLLVERPKHKAELLIASDSGLGCPPADKAGSAVPRP